MAVLPTPGSPMRTGLFLVRRERTWMTRRISSSRPMTGSSLPLRASSVRSLPYFSRAWYLASGFWSVTRWEPRTAESALRTASWVAPMAARASRVGSPLASVSASRRCSVEMYSSLKDSASLEARSRTLVRAFAMPGVLPPETLGSLEMAVLAPERSSCTRTPAPSSTGRTTPSRSSSRAASRCMGRTSGLPFSAAMDAAAWRASCDLTVSFSHLNAITVTNLRPELI